MWHLNLTVNEFRKPKRKEKGWIYLDAFPELFSVSRSQSVKKAGSSFLSGHQVVQVVIPQCSRGRCLTSAEDTELLRQGFLLLSALLASCYKALPRNSQLTAPVLSTSLETVLPRSHLTTDSSAPSRGFSQYWRCSHLVGRLAPSAATPESHTWHLTSCSETTSRDL